METSETTLPLAPTLAPLDDDPRRGLVQMGQLGFRYVQLSASIPGMRPRELDASARRDLNARLRRSELSVSGIDLWIPLEHYLDAGHVDRAVGTTCETIELAGDLGRCPVSLTLPVDTGDESRIAEVIETVAAHADRFGVAIADHATPHSEHSLIGVGHDPAAALGRGDDSAQVVAGLGSRLVSARLCDLLRSGLRGPIGDSQEGRLDVEAYRIALSVIGYSHPVVVDARQWANPWIGLEQTQRVWEDCARA